MQLTDFADWQSQDGGVGQNIDDTVGVPKSSAVGATRMFDALVPECCHTDTLEDCSEQGANCPPNDDKQVGETEPSEDIAHENPEVQTENRDLVKAEDQLVEDLRKIEPLPTQLQKLARNMLCKPSRTYSQGLDQLLVSQVMLVLAISIHNRYRQQSTRCRRFQPSARTCPN